MAPSRIRTAGWALAALAALGGAGYALRDRLAAPRPEVAVAAAERPAQPVRVTRVHLASNSLTQSYTGTIRPQHEAPLAFRLAGKLVSRLVEAGDTVAAGQVVARLDDTDARLQLATAEDERRAARTDLSRAKAEVSRSRDLFAAGHVAQAALDRATSALAEAASRADRAERAVRLAANALSYMALVAETDGIVTATEAEAGQVVAAGQPVLTLAAAGARDVVFALPEQRRGMLEGATARATLWGAEGAGYALTLRDISPDVEPVGRTYRVRMTLQGPGADAALGRTVTVRLALPAGPPAATLPLAAVLNEGTGAAVWRLPAGADRVERVAVRVAGIDGQVARVEGGLAEGDLVISLGAHKIDPARPVRVVETAAQPES